MIGIIGFGNWGCALAHHLGELGANIIAWDYDPSIFDSVNNDRKHPRYHSDIVLSKNIRIVKELNDLNKASEMLLITQPSHTLEQSVWPEINSEIPVVSAVKGFVGEKALTPVQFLSDKLDNPLVAFSGPSFAYDVIRGMPLGIVAASHDEKIAQQVAKIFSGRGMRVYPSADVRGVELGGAVKNVIAIAAGVSDGLGYGDSTRAAIITRGLAEMIRLATACGASFQTLCGLSGLGDLLMTASSSLSRNRTVGFRLGKGESLESIISTIGSTAEGVETAQKVLYLAKTHNIEVPITSEVSKLLSGEVTPQEMEENLLKRELALEFR